jgi:hypothetical protein
MAILKLKHPLTFGKKTIDQLNFRDYTTAGDYLSFDKRGGVAQRIALIAGLSGTDEALIEQLRGPDWLAAERMADALLDADNAVEVEENADSEDAAEKKSSE